MTLSTEMTLLGWSVVLLLVQIVLQASASAMETGLPYALTPRDERREPRSAMTGRLDRGLRNLLETYPAFVALALAIEITGQAGGMGAIGAQIWFWARVLYVPVYALGIPVVRTILWTASVVGLVMMLIELLT